MTVGMTLSTFRGLEEELPMADGRVGSPQAGAPAKNVEEGRPEDAILFVGASLILGVICRQLFKGTKVPYTVALLILGICLGAIEYGTERGLGALGTSIRIWSTINPDLILFVFLPALLFESSFAMDIHQIKRCIVQMVLLAGPGVLISTACLALVNRYVFPYGWNWSTCLLLGGLLSATDPVAVVALLKELGASKKLSTIVEGESLMNDGVAIVVYKLFFQMVLGRHFSAGDIIKFFTRVAFGACALGIGCGLVAVFWIGRVFNDTIVEITLTLAASYMAFFVAEDELEVSGVLTVMTIGMFFAAFARTAFTGESHQSMHHFWEMIAYIANTLIFILSGTVIAERILQSRDKIEANYVYAVRRVYSNDEADRGSGGVVLLTLTINGSTTQFLLRLLRMNRASETKVLVLDYVRHEMYSKALESFGELCEDEDLGQADWATVCKYVTCLGQLSDRETPTHPHGASITQEQQRKLALQDTRIRFLNGVQAAYWGMLEEGRISRTSATLLMRSVDEALDQVARDGTLQDWKGVQPHVHFPQYLKWRSSTMLSQRLLTFLTVGRLELGCYVSAAFLRAHLQARRQLREFLGESEIADAVIEESQAEGGEARDFLEDIRLSFPQILRIIKTKQVIYAVLVRLNTYVTSLEEAGLLEARETSHLHDVVQVDLKKLDRNPPLVKMPSAIEALSNQPFFGALPIHIQSDLVPRAKELMMFRSNTLYNEGAKSGGVWLVANGSVKWSSNKYKDRHLLHPLFPHGSTLGLYEALTGKPLLCSVTADSVVQCFFIENAKLMSALDTEPGMEDFFWQESALVVAKLVVPQHFETVSMQDLRALIMESSHMQTYIHGEVIELEVNNIGILLEGFVKKEGSDDMISAPAGLLSMLSEVHPAIKGSRTSVLLPQNVYYHVVARSRVLFLDLQSTQRTHSFSSTSSALPFQLSREHSGLLRFPSMYRNSGRRLSDVGRRSSMKSGDISENHSASYSAKALELSVFGSKVKLGETSLASGYVERPLGTSKSQGELYPIDVRGEAQKQSSSVSTLPGPAKVEARTRDKRRVNSEGSLVAGRPFQKPRHTRGRSQSGYSTGESDGEDDHIVEISSPSSLFHPHHPV